MSTETPAYTVERRDGNFEIRRYPHYILAQVDVPGDYRDAIGAGFRILAHYIFGGNRRRSSIPMTAPVSEELVSGPERIAMIAPVLEETLGLPQHIHMTTPVTREVVAGTDASGGRSAEVHRISFTMPAAYTLDTLPEPDDPRIRFREVRDQRVARPLKRSTATEQLEQQKIRELQAWLGANRLQPRSNFVLAQYNHPAVPGFARRNEIMVEIG
ncbi:MAG: heme-binding protein [Syntrophomonadaceae bacterium]|jgi:hypothetical protein|nr:heme-binding protein [Syntrophomonadaceae bacterium]